MFGTTITSSGHSTGNPLVSNPFGVPSNLGSTFAMPNASGTTSGVFGTTCSPSFSTISSSQSPLAFGGSASGSGIFSAPVSGFSSSASGHSIANPFTSNPFGMSLNTGSTFAMPNASGNTSGVVGFGGLAGGSGPSAFGVKSSSGASSTSGFGFSSTPAVSQWTMVFGRSDLLGATKSSFGTQSSFSGSHVSLPPFGGQKSGSRVITYAKTAGVGSSAQTPENLVSISAIPIYKDKSFEELRCEDYQSGDKGGFISGIFNPKPNAFNPFSLTPSPVTPTSSIFAPSSVTSTSSIFTPSVTPTSSIFTPSVTTTSSIFTPSVTPTSSIFTPSLTPTSSIFTPSSLTPTSSIFTPSVTPTSSIFTPSSLTPTSSIFTPSSLTPTSSIFTPSSLTPTSSIFTPSSLTPTSSIFTPSVTPTSSIFTPSVTPTSFIFTPSSVTPTSSIFTPSSVTPNSSIFTPSLTPTSSIFTPSLTPTSSIFTPSSVTPTSSIFTPSSLTPTSSIYTPSITPASSISFSPSSITPTSPIYTPSITPASSITFAPSSITTAAPVSSVNPYGSLPPVTKISITGPRSVPTVHYGISSLPIQEKPAPVRVPSLLTVRHITWRNRSRIQKYDPKVNGPKVPFYVDDREIPDPQIVPRENPRALVIRPTEHWPLRTNLKNYSGIEGKLSSIHIYDNGENCSGNVDTYSEKPKTGHTDDDTKVKEWNPLVKVHKVEELLPKLQVSDYYTEPGIQEMAAKERAEPGYCSHVKDFVIGRHGYGSIKFMGETDLRSLDLESIIIFNNREVIVYNDEKKKPPVGQGLNKPAEVTLLNIKCFDKKTGNQYLDGPRLEKYREMLTKKAKEQGAEFVSYDPVGGKWKFRVQHF